jgi:hypothetical protein
MFERNIGHIAKLGKEVELWVEGLPSPKVGFLAGLDDEFIQLCLTDNQTLSNIRRDMVVSVDETGRTIGSLRNESFDGSEIDRIRQKVKHFQNKASMLYGRRDNA